MTETLDENGLLKSSPSTIFTFSGAQIDPLRPFPALINVVDIAHALSQQCRWTGHTTRFYSVAEHCVLVSRLLYDKTGNRELAFEGLLHDASEAYLSDIARPVKKSPEMSQYLEIEAGLEDAIAEAFGITPPPMNDQVKWADDQLLRQEAHELIPSLAPHMPEPDEPIELFCWDPLEAELKWKKQYEAVAE